MNLIEVENLSKTFKTKLVGGEVEVLKDLSFSIRPSIATGFLGANGAGKTTFVKILLRFLKADSGKVNFNPALGSSFQEVLKNIGFMPERPYFYQCLTGWEFLYYLGSLSNMKKSQINNRVVSLASQLTIDFALDREIKTYSKGMLQRLGFLASLLHDPDLLVFDEPLSGLDPVGRRDLKNLIKDILKDGKTVFMSSHILSDIQELCEDVIVLDKGALQYQGDIENLLKKSTKNLFEVEYINSMGAKEVKEVAGEHLNQLITEIVHNDGQIRFVGGKKVKLEEVIYKL